MRCRPTAARAGPRPRRSRPAWRTATIGSTRWSPTRRGTARSATCSRSRSTTRRRRRGRCRLPGDPKSGAVRPSLSGNADLNGTSVAYEVSTDGGASWSSTAAIQTSLADGDYRFHAVVTDPAGNSSISNVLEVKVDNTAPTAGTLSFTGLTDTGSSQSPAITQDGTFDLSLSGNADLN